MDDEKNGGRPLRILHLEDSPGDAEIIRERLADAGFFLQVEWAANELEYTAFLQSGGFDLVLADYRLPRFEAPEALRLMQSFCPGVPFICVSGAIGEEKVVELLKQGATDYVSKNRLDKLPLAMERALNEVRERTAHRLATEALRDSSELVQLLLNSTAEAIYGVDMDGLCTLFNAACLRILGYERTEQLLGKNMHNLIHHTHADGTPFRSEECQMFRAIVHGENMHVDDEVLWRADGSSFPAEYWSYPIRKHGSIIGSVVTFMDITERKQNEEKMRKLSQAVEQSPISIVITDTRGVIEFVNPKFSQITGYEADEAVGCSPRILKSGAIAPEIYQKMWSTISSGNVWEGEFLNKKKNGELFWEEATISPIKNNKGVITHYLAIKEDVTDKKKLKEQLLQSQKMEAIGQLAGGVAHDFNNILTVIMGYCSLLSMRPKFDDTEKEALEHIRSAAEKATHLTRGLLAFSRKQVMDTKPVNLNDLVQQVQKFLVRIIGEDIKLKVIYNDVTLRVMADAGQIEQVLMNLATNARDAMPKGGELTIETAHQHIDDFFVQSHGWGKPGHYALVTVTDTGCGMDEATRNRIFEPFYTTKEAGKGTGLGMSIVHGIVSQHNGFIYVYSEKGRGTSFKIFLPLIAEEELADNEKRVVDPVEGGTETILVVEDDAAVRKVVEMFLINYGYEVISAKDGEEAVEKFNANSLAIKLILMDMIMPKKSGMEAYRQIKHNHPDVKVLFTSGYTADFIQSRGELDKGVDLIMKPVKPAELMKKVREMLDREA